MREYNSIYQFCFLWRARSQFEGWAYLQIQLLNQMSVCWDWNHAQTKAFLLIVLVLFQPSSFSSAKNTSWWLCGFVLWVCFPYQLTPPVFSCCNLLKQTSKCCYLRRSWIWYWQVQREGLKYKNIQWKANNQTLKWTGKDLKLKISLLILQSILCKGRRSPLTVMET